MFAFAATVVWLRSIVIELAYPGLPRAPVIVADDRIMAVDPWFTTSKFTVPAVVTSIASIYGQDWFTWASGLLQFPGFVGFVGKKTTATPTRPRAIAAEIPAAIRIFRLLPNDMPLT